MLQYPWRVVLSLALPLLLASCGHSTRKEPVQETSEHPSPLPVNLGAPQIRVAFLKGQNLIKVYAHRSAVEVIDPNGQVLARIPSGQQVEVQAAGNRLLLSPGGALPPTQQLNFLPTDRAGQIHLAGGERFAALTLILESSGGNRFSCIAHLSLEEYLMGVLAGEVPIDRWGLEALKAQAVTSRSYALFQMKSHAERAYDVECTVMDQVFKPQGEVNPKALRAVESTHGMIVTDNGALFPAYFHSTCGGRTAAAQSIFTNYQGQNRTLSGVRCPFCAASPSYRWRASLPKSDLETALARTPSQSGQPVGSILGLSFEGGLGRPARAEIVRVTHSRGSLTMPAQQFRLLAGPAKLKSTVVEAVYDHGSNLEIQGYGFGHGVGLCQYGCQGMSEKGYEFREILGYYFPGGELTTLYGQETAAKGR